MYVTEAVAAFSLVFFVCLPPFVAAAVRMALRGSRWAVLAAAASMTVAMAIAIAILTLVSSVLPVGAIVFGSMILLFEVFGAPFAVLDDGS